MKKETLQTVGEMMKEVYVRPCVFAHTLSSEGSLCVVSLDADNETDDGHEDYGEDDYTWEGNGVSHTGFSEKGLDEE